MAEPSPGKRVNTWTVNEREEIEEMFERGVDSVIGNYPDIVQEIQENYSK